MDGSGEEAFEGAETRVPDREGQAEPRRRPLGLRDELLVRNLGQEHDLAIVAEIEIEKLGKAVEPETLDHQRVEVTDEEIREEEGRRLLFGQGGEIVPAEEELVAVRALDALHRFLGENLVEEAARTAIAVKAKHPVVGIALRPDLGANRLGDVLRAVVQARGEAGDREMVPAVEALEQEELPRERAAGDNQGPGRVGGHANTSSPRRELRPGSGPGPYPGAAPSWPLRSRPPPPRPGNRRPRRSTPRRPR